MDQLKVAFRYIKRVHFWILCPLVTLIGVAAWYLAVGSLDEQREEFVSGINKSYTDVSSWDSPHPNEKVAEAMTTLIDKTRTEISEAWKNKAEQQGEVLKWTLPWDQGTTNQFLRVVEPLRPIERFVEIDEDKRTIKVEAGSQLNKRMRELYKVYVEGELPSLAKTAGAVWALRGGRVITESDEQENAIVNWNVKSQQEINKQHFTDKWKKEGNKTGVPSTLEVLYAQEDLWVLGHLMQIIARTNENATTRHSAVIREIIDLKIGKEAVDSNVEIVSISTEKPERVRPEPPDPNAIPNPADGRYVDNNYEPLAPEVLKMFMGKSDAEIELEQAYLAVAKRIPLRMRVSMDQRSINKLLVECANSELTVEVRQLTIDADDGQGRRGSGGGLGGFGDNAFNPGGGGGGGGADKDTGSQFPFDLEVEIYGIVSIYNPVDNKALGIETEEDSAEEEEARAAAGTIRR